MIPLQKYAILIVLLGAALACSLTGSPATPTAAPQPTPTIQPSEIPAATATVAPSSTPAATEQPAVTDTPNPLAGAGLGPFAQLQNISQYFNPVGQPVKEWNGIPIMPQATAGQEWQGGTVYSFKAAGSISDAVAFYQAQIPTLGYSSFMAGPATGSAGTGANAIHNSVLIFYKGSQMLLLYIASYDSDPGHFSVVISTQ